MQHSRSTGSARSHLLVLIAALAAGLGLWFAQSRPMAPRPAFETAVIYPQPRPLPAFSLQAADDTTFQPDDLSGRWHVAFIGFTHCPDVCPTTMADLARAEKRWQAELSPDRQPRILFVSVDPGRDSPRRALDYARHFSPQARAVTGTSEALQAFTRSLGMVFMKVALEGGDYTLDHSTQVALIDPQGRLAGFARSPLQVESLARDVVRLAKSGR